MGPPAEPCQGAHHGCRVGDPTASSRGQRLHLHCSCAPHSGTLSGSGTCHPFSHFGSLVQAEPRALSLLLLRALHFSLFLTLSTSDCHFLVGASIDLGFPGWVCDFCSKGPCTCFNVPRWKFEIRSFLNKGRALHFCFLLGPANHVTSPDHSPSFPS